MKRGLILMALLLVVPAYCGYKLVFRNGAVLEVTAKPDLSGTTVRAQTTDGKRVILPVRLLDLAATEVLNRPLPPKPPVPEKTEKPEARPVPVPTTETPTAKPLIITEETVGKPEKRETRSESGGANNRSVPASEVEEEPGAEPRGPVDDQGRDERYWREQFARNRNETTAVQTRIEQVQMELNRLTGERIRTDDEVYRRQLIGKINQLQAGLDKLNRQLETLKAQKQKLLEEARRSGALPGWYRDYVD